MPDSYSWITTPPLIHPLGLSSHRSQARSARPSRHAGTQRRRRPMSTVGGDPGGDAPSPTSAAPGLPRAPPLPLGGSSSRAGTSNTGGGPPPPAPAVPGPAPAPPLRLRGISSRAGTGNPVGGAPPPVAQKQKMKRSGIFGSSIFAMWEKASKARKINEVSTPNQTVATSCTCTSPVHLESNLQLCLWRQTSMNNIILFTSFLSWY